MKNFKIYIFIVIAVLFLCFANIVMLKAASVSDSATLQPMPPDTQPDLPNNINRNENNVSTNNYIQPVQPDQPSQADTDAIITELDKNISYTDTDNHVLYVSEPDNNRVLVFDVSSIKNGESAVSRIL